MSHSYHQMWELAMFQTEERCEAAQQQAKAAITAYAQEQPSAADDTQATDSTDLQQIKRLKELISRKCAEVDAAEQKFAQLLRTSLPSDIKLLILEYELQIFGDSSFEKWDTRVFPKIVGRFMGDSDRRFVLLYRSVSFSLCQELGDIMAKKNEKFLFVLRHVRQFSVFDEAEQVSQPFRIVLGQLFSARGMPQLRSFYCYSCNSIICSNQYLMSKVVSRILNPMIELQASQTPKLVHVTLSELQEIPAGMISQIRKSSLKSIEMYFCSIQVMEAILQIRQIRHVELDSGTRYASPLSPSTMKLSHLESLRAVRMVNQISKITVFQNIRFLRFGHGCNCDEMDLAGVHKLPFLRCLQLYYKTLPMAQLVSASDLTKCPLLSSLHIKGSFSEQNLDSWVRCVLTPLVESKQLEDLSFMRVDDETLRSWVDPSRCSNLCSIDTVCTKLSLETIMMLIENDKLRLAAVEGLEAIPAEVATQLKLLTQWDSYIKSSPARIIIQKRCTLGMQANRN